MKQPSPLWPLAGFAITTLGGTLLHYLYDWTGGSPLIAPFSSINESTWEHMKSLFWPMFFFSLFQYPFFKDRKNFWCIKLFGILLGLVLIPVLFYTYNGVFGPSSHRINISIFYIAAGAAFLLEGRLFKQDRLSCRRPWTAFAMILLIAGLFVVFTFIPPEISLFQERVICFSISA